MPTTPHQEDSLPTQTSSNPHDISSPGTQSQVEQPDHNNWQTVHFPGAIAVDQIPEDTSHLRTNAMDSFSTNPSSTLSPEHQTQHEAELLSLIRDLNDCNDVLLAKVSQLEESLERSQTALQAEIDRSGPPIERSEPSTTSDREIAHLITELEQSSQSLQHHQMLNKTLQTELLAAQEHTAQLEIEHTSLLHQHNEQSQALLQANTSCRDLRARLQRQQRYTMQFKAALEKCLNMAPAASNRAVSLGTSDSDSAAVAMPKTDRIRPWDAAGTEQTKTDPQLTSMIRGLNPGMSAATSPSPAPSTLEIEAETQLWQDLARVMDPAEAPPEADNPIDDGLSSPQFTEPSPWSDSPAKASTPIPAISDVMINKDEPLREDLPKVLVSPPHSEILARVQAAREKASETYLPAMSAQESSPSPLVNPLRPQKRIESLSAIDLPSFPRLKKQPQS